MISTAPPFVPSIDSGQTLRLSKDERRVFQQNRFLEAGIQSAVSGGSPLTPGRKPIDHSPRGPAACSTIPIRIADLTITLSSYDPGLKVRAQGAIEQFLIEESDPDARVRASWGDLSKVKSGAKIFDSGGLWRLYDDEGLYRFQFHSSVFGAAPYKEARFNADFSYGEVTLHHPYFTSGSAAYPLEYPLDELLVTHLLAHRRGAEVHSSGVVDDSGNGHLFVGQSGGGKTTMAKLWQQEKGITILSDDRIVLRNMDGRIWMYGTPWHGEGGLSDPSRAPLKQIYFLRHGEKNELLPQTKTEAVGRLFACSFPPFYDPRALDFTLAFFEAVAAAVPCYELSFVPDERVIGFIVED